MSVPRPSGGTGGGGIPIDFLNGSILDAGDPSYGSNSGGGIEQLCAADYRQRWEGGRLWFYDQNGTGVREVQMNFSAPSVNDDDRASMRFRVGSRWVHQDGREWVCRDATEGAAVWDLVSSQPDVVYVTTKGDDTTGDGSMSNPFRTLQKVCDDYVSINMSIVVNLGVGSFSANAPNWNANAQITGAGCNLTYVDIFFETPLGGSAGSFDIRADHCTITAAYTGLDGEPGANGDPNGDQSGGGGGQGSSGGSITIEGLCRVANVSTKGGDGGGGGNGVYDSNGEGGGNGGGGGDGGNAGQITLQVLKVSGVLDASGGIGGSGGMDATGNSQASSGSSGNGGSISIDGADARNTSTVITGASSGNLYIARCSYDAGLGTITNDYGGSALY